MSEGTTERRSSWWIWLFLLLLALIIFFCIRSHLGGIQGSVAACVAPIFQNAGIAEDRYRIEGRDVFLEGDIDASVDTVALEAALEEQDCTSRVFNQYNPIASLPSSMMLNKSESGMVTLTGNMPDEASIKVINDAAVAEYGADNVDNQMKVVANTRTPVWLNGMDSYIEEIDAASPAGIDANDDRIILSGLVRSEGDKMALGEKASAAFLDTVPVTNSIEVMGPVDSSSVAYRLGDGGKVTLTGTLPDQVSIDTAVTAAAGTFGADNVINQLTISDMSKPAAWLTGLGAAVPGMGAVANAALSASDDGIILEGIVDANEKRQAVESEAKAAFGDLPIDNRIQVVLPLTTARLVMDMPAGPDGDITLSGDMPDQAAVTEALGAAGTVFAEASVANSMTVTDRVNSPAWIGGLGSVVDAYRAVSNGRVTVDDGGVILEGTVDAPAKRQAIEDATRSAMADLAIDNRIQVVVPRTTAKLVMDMPDGASGKVMLSGEMPDQSAMDDAMKAAGMVFAQGSMSSSMTMTDRVMSPGWVSGLGSVVDAYRAADNGRITIDDGGILLEGLVDTDAKRDAIGAAAAGTGVAVTNQVKVVGRADGNVVYTWGNGGITLDGTLASQGEVDAAVKAASDAVGAGNVVNNLKVGDRVADSGWLDGVARLVPGMNGIEEAIIRANNGGIELEGLVRADAAKADMGSQADSLLSSFGVRNMIRVIDIKQALVNIDLRGIQFETNSAQLTGSSSTILDQAVAVLNQYGDVRVEVAGHTDSVGVDAYNLDLSTRRTQSVMDYLTSKGIDGGRLVARGYGESRPIADNGTPEGRALNRRIELVVIE